MKLTRLFELCDKEISEHPEILEWDLATFDGDKVVAVTGVNLDENPILIVPQRALNNKNGGKRHALGKERFTRRGLRAYRK